MELAPGGSGHLVGAVVLVATSCWYLFLENAPDETAEKVEPAERA